MKLNTRSDLRRWALAAALVSAVALVLAAPTALATTQYLGDGALQNTRGGFDIPAQGQCPGATTQGYLGIDTRPECTAMRLNIVQASCTGNYAWSTGVCNDLVNTTQTTCQAQPDRLWNAGTGVCAIVMADDDRNDVTCALHGGTWITSGACTGNWIMPARTAYTPNLLTGNGPGDQCLRCHNSRTQYNSPRVRDTEDTMYMGHKNMVRPVTPGIGWGGPGFECTIGVYATEEACFDGGGDWVPMELYPSDDTGNAFNWNTGRITVNGVDRDLTWIYGDWIAPLPRAIYKTDPSTSLVCTDPRGTSANCASTYGGAMVANAGASYSCGRCHATGWTSDSAINTNPATNIESKEPEATFPNITWPRTAAAGFGVVNMSGGVMGDPNKYSSWDVWGISCTRCHSSAIDTTNVVAGSNPPQYNAAAGMSTHHSNMTAADNNSGVCSDTRFTAVTQCTAAGGTWLTACSVNPTNSVCTIASNTSATCATNGGTWVAAPGWCQAGSSYNAYYTDAASCTANGTCSNALYSTQTTCTTGGGTWTAYTWQDGWCTTADAQGTCTGGSGATAKTWRVNGSQASCQVAAATWSFSKCSVAGVCNLGAAYTTAQTCSDAGGQWRFANDIIRCDDAGGRWTGNYFNRGQLITSVCMQCHRQETSGLPNGATSTDGVTVDYTNALPSTNLKVGQYHSTLTFVSHPHGNMFLNSPHAKFIPSANFSQIGMGRFNYAMTGEYRSYFMTEAEAANTGNGCTGCHEVHTSTVAGEDPFREECTGCHAGPYKKDLTKINHLWGKGTPMQDAATDESTACESCHMPEGMHFFRINSDPNYSTIPPALATADTSAECTALGGTWTASSSTCSNVNANTAPEGTYANAVWVDVDAACGQCHGGGTSYAETTGTVATGSKTLTVASATGFIAGERVQIADAGNFTYEDGGPVRGDFDTYITAISGNTITLVGTAPIGVTNVAVRQNPTVLVEPGRYAPYYTKAALAAVAKGMHESAGVNYSVTFSTTINPSDTPGNPARSSLRVKVDADVDCGGTCGTLTYDWDWADATLHGFGDPDYHLYAAGGTYPITLVVKENGLKVGEVTRNVTVTAPNNAPIALGACTWTGDTWTMGYQDASTDETPATMQVIVDWGDGGAKSNVTPGGTATKIYTRPGTFTVTVKAIDAQLQSSTYSCTTQATPAYFTIGGTVFASNGTTPVANARVILYKGGVQQTSTLTLVNGTYSFGNLKPGTYSINVSRTGYRFAIPAIPSITVGPVPPPQNVTALPPSGASISSPRSNKQGGF